MLKLEKLAKTDQISVALRQKEPLISKRLGLAFAFALIIHLAAALIFEVRPFRILSSQTVIAPLVVDADSTPGAESSVLAQIDEENAPRFQHEPHGARLHLPHLPHLMQREQILVEFPHRSETHLLTSFIEPAEKEHPSVEIAISGPLSRADYTIHNALTYKSHRFYSATYAVRLDPLTGSIFWYEPLHDTQSPKLEAYADEIIRSLIFNSGMHDFGLPGEVAITFYPERSLSS